MFCWFEKNGDVNPNESVAVEPMKFIGNSSFSCQITLQSRHTEILYLDWEKTHKAIKNSLFKRLESVSWNIYEMQNVDSIVEHREQSEDFEILLHYDMQKLECCSFTTNFYNTKIFRCGEV